MPCEVPARDSGLRARRSARTEVEAVAAAIAPRRDLGLVRRGIPGFEEEFADYVGCAHGVAVTSGTTALQLAVARGRDRRRRRGPRQRRARTSRRALAAYHNGAMRGSRGLRGGDVEPRSRPPRGSHHAERTHAIMPVHLFGHPVDMDAPDGDRRPARPAGDRGLRGVARRHRPRPDDRLASATMGCFSFYANKIITTGEGGMVLTNDERPRRAAAAAAEPRLPAAAVPARGGGLQLPDDRLPGGDGRCPARQDRRTSSRRSAASPTPMTAARGCAGVATPVERDWARNVYWMYAIVVEDEFPLDRDELDGVLAERGHRVAHVLLPDEPAAVPAAAARLSRRSRARWPRICGRRACTCRRRLALGRRDRDDRRGDRRSCPALRRTPTAGLHAASLRPDLRGQAVRGGSAFVGRISTSAAAAAHAPRPGLRHRPPRSRVRGDGTRGHRGGLERASCSTARARTSRRATRTSFRSRT